MTKQTTSPADQYSFKEFLLKDRRNRICLYLAVVAILIQFTIFKYIYPFASFIHGDSFSYLQAAEDNSDVSTYLVGYSRFLRLFSVFSKSDLALTAFQYLFLQSSSLFMLFSIFYFYGLRKITQIVLLVFTIFNPLFLYLSNLISSDNIFVSISLIWFTLLLWIIQKPSQIILLIHTIVLFLSFTVRYNALIYPFISAVAICLSNLSISKKISAISAGTLLCALFICYNSYQYRKITGYWQYSPFSGWQFANNAMYAYRYVESSERKQVHSRFKDLDNMIRAFFDSTHNTKKFRSESAMASTFYMWSPGMPLMKYRNQIFKNDTTASELKRWASMGPFYKEFGIYIIKMYPWHFIRYFIWPNANKYYAPPVEFLKFYNSGRRGVTQQAKEWFEYKSIDIKSRSKNTRAWILDIYPILSGITNIIMLFSLICYIYLKGWKLSKRLSKGLLLGSTVWILNAGFTIFASSAALRFQSFPIILTSFFVTILIDWMFQSMALMNNSSIGFNTEHITRAELS